MFLCFWSAFCCYACLDYLVNFGIFMWFEALFGNLWVLVSSFGALFGKFWCFHVIWSTIWWILVSLWDLEHYLVNFDVFMQFRALFSKVLFLVSSWDLEPYLVNFGAFMWIRARSGMNCVCKSLIWWCYSEYEVVWITSFDFWKVDWFLSFIFSIQAHFLL